MEMKLSIGIVFAALLLVAAQANLLDNLDDNTTRPELPEGITALFTTKHDIVNIVAVNGLSPDKLHKCGSINNANEHIYEPVVFFSVVDKNDGGTPRSYGEYVGLGPYTNKTFHKILENGLSVTTDDSDHHIAYIGAEDGIYKFNVTDGSMSKYGTINDTVIQIKKAHGHDHMYILSERDKRIYNLTDNGEIKTVIASIPCATNFVIDYENNIYYHCHNYKLFVLADAHDAPVSINIIPQHGILVFPYDFPEMPPQYYTYNGTIYDLYPEGTFIKDKSMDVIDLTAFAEDICYMRYLAYYGNLYGPGEDYPLYIDFV